MRHKTEIHSCEQAFDQKKHEEKLSCGGFSLKKHSKGIYIDTMSTGSIGQGFGTAVMRHAAEKAFKEEGNVYLQAAWSSHLFHLFMGMIPDEREIDYINLNYGFTGVKALKSLKKITNVEDLQNQNQHTRYLIRILKCEIPSPKRRLTEQDVIENREFLLSLLDKTCSYIRCNFIPTILDILSDHLNKHSTEKYPETRRLTSVNMHLSPEGIIRWQEAITKKIEFVPFKNFEQLLPFMDEQQKQELNIILEKQAKKFSEMSLKSCLYSIGFFGNQANALKNLESAHQFAI